MRKKSSDSDTKDSHNQGSNNSASLYAKILGFICILGASATWVTEAKVVAVMEREGAEYIKPIFISYFLNSGYSVLSVPWLMWILYSKWRGRDWKDCFEHPIDVENYVRSSTVLSFVFFVGGFLWYDSLDYIPVSDSTSIFVVSSVFVFILSVFLLGESVNLTKLLSVVLCCLGTLLISYTGSLNEAAQETLGEKSGPKHSHAAIVFGYTVGIVSTAMSALYETYYQILIVDPDERDTGGNASLWQQLLRTLLMLALVGTSCLLLFWPVVAVAHVMGVESFALPESSTWFYLIICSIIDAADNFFLLFGIFFSSPLHMSVGSLLAIPLSVIVDYFFSDYVLAPLALFGVVVSVVGFIILNYAEAKEEEEKKKHMSHAQKATI